MEVGQVRPQAESKVWVFARYYGTSNKSRQDRRVFGDRKGGAYLDKFSWTSIVRLELVHRGASPDHPALAEC